MFLKKLFFYAGFLMSILSGLSGKAQESLSSDELFKQARSAAFDQKNYPLAIELSKKALSKSPGYADIRIFLGRVYTWLGQTDSARYAFEEVLRQQPDYEDASAAYADLEYWNDNPEKALTLCNEGLKFHPQSKTLLLKKAKCLTLLKEFQEANRVVNSLLKYDPQNAEVRSLSERIKNQASRNKGGISYDFVGFDKQFTNPWHLVSLSYSRSTGMGSVIGRVNYANRFTQSALQFEADAYPRISKTFYSYINVGISDTSSVFPHYRAGFSLYANLPHSFEAEAGFRYLFFNEATWIYTGSVGKYFKNYWFNLRSYLTPGRSNISHSYSLTTRYYFGGAEDYFALGLRTGISPDDRNNNVQLSSPAKLKSNGISAEFNKSFRGVNIINLTGAWQHQEYLPSTFGNQFSLGIGYQKRF